MALQKFLVSSKKCFNWGHRWVTMGFCHGHQLLARYKPKTKSRGWLRKIWGEPVGLGINHRTRARKVSVQIQPKPNIKYKYGRQGSPWAATRLPVEHESPETDGERALWKSNPMGMGPIRRRMMGKNHNNLNKIKNRNPKPKRQGHWIWCGDSNWTVPTLTHSLIQLTDSFSL